MINIRRTEPNDFTTIPWRAEIDLVGTWAEAFIAHTGPASAQACIVVCFGQSPEHALSECYKSIGVRAVALALPDRAAP